MAKVKQKVIAKTTTTKIKTRTKKSNGSKRGNQKRCPACGRFM